MVSLLVYVFLNLLAGGLLAALATVSWHNRSKPGAKWFLVAAVLDAVWAFLAAGGLLVPDTAPTLRMGIELVTSSIAAYAPIPWVAFVLCYTGYGNLVTRRRLGILVGISSLLTVVTVTNPLHHLYFVPTVTASGVVSYGEITVVRSDPGPLLLVTLLYVYALVLVGFGFILRTVYERDYLFRGQAFGLIAGTLTPILVAIPKMFNLIQPPDVPVTPAAMTVMAVGYGYALYRYRLFELVPATRQIGEHDTIQSLDEGVVITDESGTVIDVNESACRQLDCSRSVVLGGPVTDAFSEASDVPIAGTLEVERDARVYEVSASLVETVGSGPIGTSYVIRDVTERHNRKQHLEVVNRVLRHNLRNDMNVVQGYAMELASTDDPHRTEMAETIAARADELITIGEKARLIQETLAESDQAFDVDLERVVVDVLGSVREESPYASIGLETEDTPTVRVDPTVLEVVVRNVVENAVEHAGPDPNVRIRLHSTTDGAHVVVEDDGPGIPQSELDAIANGTETALEHVSGLGLWLIHWGTRQIGGEAAFRADETGTTVELQLPTTGSA